MKLQANELPLMKNQTRRKTSPKIAPLVVLALFLLTIIPIYYPLLKYPTKNSLKPSSSSGISLLDPLCHDDLSQENGHCSHHDVEKSSLVTSREDLVTTDHGGDVETSSTTRENNVVTAHDRDVEKLLRNHDTERDVETKGTMKDSDLMTAHDSDDDTVVETMPKKHNIVHDGDDTGVETLSRKQNPGRNVETKLSKSGLVPGHDGDDDTVVETLPKKQNRGTELETDSNLRKSDAEELPNGDIDDMVVVTLQKKPNPSKEVKTKPILKQSDTDVEELDSGDMSAAAAAATTTTTPTPDKDVKTTMHRRRYVGKSSAAASKRGVAEREKCDIFSGSWVPDPDGPYYTNMTCREIQEHQNCIKFGRPDVEYLKWRWKPDGCELPMFDPYQFMELMRGKSLAFVGDSVARNHMQSLICLLSRAEYPIDVSYTPDEHFKRWKYTSYNFTMATFWTPFLIKTQEADPNGPTQTGLFNLYLDEPDDTWTTQISEFDYVIISAGHWFYRPALYYENRRLVGCRFCQLDNITDLPMYYGYRRAFRTAFKAINNLKDFKGITYLRTFAPSHFEGGLWNQGGNCVRKRPFMSNEKQLEGEDLELYMTQVEEYRVGERKGREKGLRYRLLDTTQAMLLRPDGHPSIYGHWAHENVTLYNDCVHWCLPGPIDTWSDLLLEMLKREGRRSYEESLERRGKKEKMS
ncbi:hypothetical protein ACSBR2_022866 [Camellia fascicularis]